MFKNRQRNQLGLECLLMIVVAIVSIICGWPAVAVGCGGGLMLGLPVWIFWNYA